MLCGEAVEGGRKDIDKKYQIVYYTVMTRKKASKRKFKTFNTSGLCIPGKHYMIDPLSRLDEVEELIDEELYFTIHAPRQTGKTTYLYALASKLNEEKDYIALVVSFESAGYKSITVEKANEVLIHSIFQAAIVQLPEKERPPEFVPGKYNNLKDYLFTWSSSQEKPVVLLVDEIDAIMDDVLISILRQLRDGYQARPTHFPSSVVLVGLRDVREYKAQIREGQESMGTASPFNIKSDSLLLTDFTKEEVDRLLDEHTTETGQVFPREVKDEIFRLTQGQPWLTNALARQIVAKILKYDFSREITLELLEEAEQKLILRRDTHLDSMVDKLKEKRVKSIVQAVIRGDNIVFATIMNDDIAYVRDLGIISRSSPLKFANPMYAEIIPRILSGPMQDSIPEEIKPPSFIEKDGKLNTRKILQEFQEFYRRNSEIWLQRYEYRESAQHLLLMAFLQRVVNSGGEIIREMAAGNGRIDLLVKYGKQEFALELKIYRDNYTLEDGKKQLHRYLDRLGLDEGYLVIFDPSEKDWDEKLYMKEIEYENKKIILVGL